jgi:hypothetical protein
MRWFIPSSLGDVQVESTGLKTCSVLVQEATAEEKRALDALLLVAIKKGWIAEGTKFGARTEMKAPIETVAKHLAKAFKPGKQLVSAVKFSNGKIEEIREQPFKTDAPPSESLVDKAKAVVETVKDVAKEAVAATTVAKPVLGCPAPDFSPARCRAREVLNVFLTPEQQEDFERYNRFMAIGGTTGHRYMVTSRTARDELSAYERSLYDLDEHRALCVHDWDIPPEEEMLALALLVQLPGHERYLRRLSD